MLKIFPLFSIIFKNKDLVIPVKSLNCNSKGSFNTFTTFLALVLSISFKYSNNLTKEATSFQ